MTNQYPVIWSANVAADALHKIIEGKGKSMDSERSSSSQSPKDVKPSMLMVQHGDEQSQGFSSSLQKLINVQMVLT